MNMRHHRARPVVGARIFTMSALAAGLLVGTSMVALPTVAQDAAPSITNRVVSDPVLVPMLRAQRPSAETASDDAEVDKDPKLDVRLTDGKIFNPATQRYDHVRLRSYVAEGAPPNPFTPFVAPTIHTRPGETVRMTINNQLQPEPGCTPSNINIPHCFNSTNLHSHGLWVSPAGNSDNVLTTIRPKVAFEYEYNIPATHPAGTFWYHPHLHGSTALQVSSGMAGALIIHGKRPPRQTPIGTMNGDIDTLLRDSSGNTFKERVVLFQQVAYACRDAAGKIKVDAKGAWVCDPYDPKNPDNPAAVGTIQAYDQLAVGTWGPSGRYTSINGEIMPRFPDAVAGRVERWRNIHAGIRDTISLKFIAMRPSANSMSLRSLGSHDAWISQNCIGEALSQFEIASDGLTHAKAIRRTTTTLQPGYRSDLLMVFPAAGTYCVIDDSIPASGSVSGQAESRRLLGTVSVAAGEAVGNDPQAYLTRQLLFAARRWMPDDVKQKVMSDLERDLGLDAFVPHATITDSELTPNSGQKVEFSIIPGNATTLTKYMVNGQAYDPSTSRDLILGNVEEWTLTSTLASHPFHIHVNPFQVSRILNPSGVDVSVPGSGDADYDGTKGTWKDTLFVKSGYTLYVRTRYQRYIGEYVLHCHILDHEDQGMMQNVRVLLPDGDGGAVPSGHH